MAFVECSGISKFYGGVKPALKNVDFSAEGGITVLIGDNGAGKTTLLKVLATLIPPDGGSYTLGGLDAVKKATQARASLGYLGHDSMLDRALTVRENLTLFARLYGMPDATARADELIERFAADAFADNLCGELSRGQEQTSALCRVLVHRPRLLLMDEPSTALDLAARDRLWAALRAEADSGTTVIFSTHDHDSAHSVSDRVVTMSAGGIVA